MEARTTIEERKNAIRAEALAIALDDTKNIEEIAETMEALEARWYDLEEEEDALDLKLEEEEVTS